MPTPWSDCKVAFGIEDEERLWKWNDKPANQRQLPKGWTLTETDWSGSRGVAVFRVDGIPTVEAGAKVAAILLRIRAALPQAQAA